MSALINKAIETEAYCANNTQQDPRQVVIVGTGPVGMRVAYEIKRHRPETPLVLFGDEPWEPYNRVRLSALLAGEVEWTGLDNSLDYTPEQGVVTHNNCAIVSIDREQRIVTDFHGNTTGYDKLVLATGSRARIPNIRGIDLDGVFTFRDMNDVQKLLARHVRSRHTVVLGAGLLGLETARAMQRFNTQVTLIEHNPRPMFRQLDEEAGNRLAEYIRSLGMKLLVGDSVRQVDGSERVESLSLRSGETLPCDTLVVAGGIVPNIDLARDSGLSVGRGIRVNDQMQTSDQNIYAAGECCEHQGIVYGLVGPGLEQAAVLASNLNGENTQYVGSLSASSLKVLEYPVFSVGDVDDSDRPIKSYTYQEGSDYRRINVDRGRLQGAIALGDWSEKPRLQEGVIHRRRIMPWNIWRFNRSGQLWKESEGGTVNDWPATATVCQCTGVTRGRLSACMASGEPTLESVVRDTGASTVCGSCKPLLVEMLGNQAKLEPARWMKTLIVAAILSLLAGLFAIFAPAIPYADSVQVSFRWDLLWTESLFKQISGFTLLGVSILIGSLSLRKRVKRFNFGGFASWRMLHVVLGAALLAVLALHTGFRSGDNLNFYLMSLFLGLMLVGSLAAAVVALQHRLSAQTGRQLLKYGIWAHILLVWPLPALLGFHIFKTYYF